MVSRKDVGCLSLVAATALLAVTPLNAQGSVDGDWEGAIVVLGQEIGIVVHFATADDGLTGTIDVPMQGAAGLPLSDLRYAHPSIHFEMLPGPRVAVFDGTVEVDSIGGAFTQSGMDGSFWLRPSESSPQASEAEEPLPYTEEEIQFENGDITLAGTLTLPEGPGPHPAVVMITGSGAQNRDEEIFGFKPFRMIADHLTRNGIGVLRYDDRGVGGSTGNVQDATTNDFAADALAGLRFLQQRPDIRSDAVGLIGHSEGAIAAPIAAARSPDVAFIVLLAGTAVTGEEVLYEQGQLILAANGATPEQLETQRQTQAMIFEAIRTDEGWDHVREHLEQQVRESVDQLPPAQREAIADVDAWVASRVEPQITGVRTAWFRFFLDYNPVTALEHVTVPVLAVFGEKDLQGPPSITLEPLEEALKAAGNQDYQIEVLPKTNHLFLASETGSPSEYAALEKQFVPGFLELISGWIGKRY
jgi:pimeloyl-ACP methyl ester carboxylesterase